MWPLLAQSVPDAPWLTFVNFGVLGVFVLLVILGQVYTKPMVDRIEKAAAERIADAIRRAEAAEKKAGECSDQLDQLNGVFREQVVPALVRSTDVQSRMVDRSARGTGGSDG